MDALTAIGLAASIIQFVLFGRELISLSTEIRKSGGHVARHGDLELIAKDLQTHSEALRARCVSANLQALTYEAHSSATELLDAINQIRGKAGSTHPTKWESFRQALEVVWKKDKITRLTTRLEMLQRRIEGHFVAETGKAQQEILGTLKKHSKYNATISLELTSKLGQTLTNLELIQRKVHDVASLVDSTNLQNLFVQFIGSFQQSTKPLMILSSLRFATMNVRQSAITEAHSRTFEWIFDAENSPPEDRRSGVKLSSWLRDGTGIYWITGKPGSGKSTLMKYLEQHGTTWSLLQKWSRPARLVRASFYFWNAGTHMQKSLEGLLQALLHETLSSCPSLIPIACKKRWTSIPELLTDTWSLLELRDAFNVLKLQSDTSTKFYFHIDGLDEYDGDHYKVIEIIDDLAHIPGFKICVSSRPWNQFKHTIGRSNNGSLQLHLFTQRDIELYARETISAHRNSPAKKSQRRLYEELIHEIGERARGVFLWVRLVVHSLKDGIFNDDPISLLKKRLEALPTDLEEFFEHILRSVDPVYGERMARTFLAAIATPEPLGLIHYSFLDEENPYFGWTHDLEPLESDEIVEKMSATRWRLNGRYKGLLEPSSEHDDATVTVDFLHRTFKDFLVQSKINDFLASLAPSHFDPIKAAMGTLFAEAKSLHSKLEHRNFIRVFTFAESLTRTTGNQSSKFTALDHIEAIWQKKRPDVAPSFLFKVAVHYRQYDYVKHRMASDHLPWDPEWTLLHLTSYMPLMPTASFALVLERISDIWDSCACDVQGYPYEANPPTALIASILQSGTDPRALIGGVAIWHKFLAAFEVNVYKKGPPYWEVLQLMVLHGAPIDESSPLWLRLAKTIGLHQPECVESTLDGFMFLLNHGLKPDARIWINLLTRLSGDSGQLQLQTLITLFLRRGSDVMKLTSIESRGQRDITWLHEFITHTRMGKTTFSGIESYVLLEIFFQHGLDPNVAFEAATLWRRLLCVINGLRDSSSYVKLIQTFLQYRADPYAEELQQMLGWRAGYDCVVPAEYEDEVKAAVHREMEDLKRHEETPRKIPHSGSRRSTRPGLQAEMQPKREAPSSAAVVPHSMVSSKKRRNDASSMDERHRKRGR